MKVTGTGQTNLDRTRDIAGGSKAHQIGESKEKRRTSQAPEVDSGVSDKVAISGQASGKAKELAQAKALAKSAPDVDEAKVAKFKAAIANGSYKVDADKIADKLVDEHLFNSI